MNSYLGSSEGAPYLSIVQMEAQRLSCRYAFGMNPYTLPHGRNAGKLVEQNVLQPLNFESKTNERSQMAP